MHKLQVTRREIVRDDFLLRRYHLWVFEFFKTFEKFTECA